MKGDVLRLAVVAAAALVAFVAAPAHAQEEDLSALAVPDSLFEAPSLPGPEYMTVFDRDNTRSNWTQSLTYGRTSRRIAVSANGNINTQELSGFENKSTFGQFMGRVSARLTRRWTVSMDGRHNMNATRDGTRDGESRRNRIQLRTQYTLSPTQELSLIGTLSSEFRRDHDLAERRTLQLARGDSGVVDTFRVQRDSSFTTGRQDGFFGSLNWKPKAWFSLNGTARASRVRPTQSNLVRDFINPQDGSGGGYVAGSPQRTKEPTDNTAYTSKFSFSKIRRTLLDVELSTSALDQSTFDKQLRGPENASYDRNSGSFRLQRSFESVRKNRKGRRTYLLTVDGGLVRSEREYALRTNYAALLHTRQMSTMASYSDTSTRFSTTFAVSRTRSERQTTGNGTSLFRSINTNASRKISDRLTLDATASAYLQVSKYDDERSDQDAARTSVRVGGGYRVSAACSTTVHFSATRSHAVFIDPSASASNNVQPAYQMNATMRLQLSRDFWLTQGYLLSADYQIFDFTEERNLLNRVRRIDTDMIDTVFTFAYVRLTHNFIFRDTGTYSREAGESSREYQVATDVYDQTLAATVGIRIARGIRFLGTQSLQNQRIHDLDTDVRTVRNRWNLTGGIEIERAVWDGALLSGAVRHIGLYDEREVPNAPNNGEDYWIAGITFQKQF